MFKHNYNLLFTIIEVGLGIIGPVSYCTYIRDMVFEEVKSMYFGDVGIEMFESNLY